MRNNLPIALFLCLFGVASAASGQSWDASGNTLLNGAYGFRQVAYRPASTSGDIAQAVTLYGTISFDGNGNYSIAGTVIGYLSPSFQSVTINGTYSISASGYGFLSSPISEGDFVYGLVSQGVFIGSSSENGFYNDLFVAVASSSSGSPSFQGPYAGGYISLVGSSRFDALVQMSPDGRGNLGTVDLTAYPGGTSAPVPTTQSGVTYAINNKVVTAAFPAEGSLKITGQQLLYVSPDGNFFAGGSATGWDIVLGFRAGSTASTPFAGLYYQAGLAQDDSQSVLGLGSFFGSFAAVQASGTIVGHQRLLSTRTRLVRDISYSDVYPSSFTGQYTSDATATKYAVSADGSIRVGLGVGRLLGLNVSVRAPKFEHDGVFLNPAGIQNSASSAPFTASIARGELVLLNGTNLADNSVVVSTSPFPTTLGGVQVFMNNVPAALYYVTPSLIAVVVPYDINTSIATIRVVKGGEASNTITAFVGSTAPGVFTNPPGGTGDAIVQHVDYSLVGEANPAQPGETVLCYLTGTGDVFPKIANGDPGPLFPLSTTVQDIVVKINGVSATVLYSGLAPTLSGMYAIVFQVPAAAKPGSVKLEIAGPDASTAQAKFWIGAAKP